MNQSRRLKVVLLAALVLLLTVSSALAWRVVAATPGHVAESASGAAANGTALGAAVAAPPVPGGPGFYSLSAFAFSQTIVDYGIAYEGPDLYNKSWDNGSYRFAAPASLPNGATVTKFILYFWDSSTDDLSASLYRVPLDGNAVEKMAETLSAGSPGYGNSATTTINSPVIDQQAYVYYVEVPLPYAPNAEIRLRGIRIDYGYGANLPLVTEQH